MKKLAAMMLIASVTMAELPEGETGTYAHLIDNPELIPVQERIEMLMGEIRSLQEQSGLQPVQITATPDASEVYVGVDVLAGRNAGGEREQTRWQAISAWVRQHPYKTAGIVAAGLVGVRIAQGELSDDIRRIRGSNRNRSGGDLSTTEADSAMTLISQIEGSGNTVNITVINQQPQGSNTGAAPTQNTGSGGQLNEQGGF